MGLFDRIKGKKKVFIIDNEDSLRKLLRARLSHAGYEIVASENGNDPIEAIKKILPRVTLIDGEMPGGAALEALARIRADKKLKAVKVFLLADESQIESIERAINLGVDNYIVKPFNPADVVERIKKAT
jgi:DNA-binding response OmpR family regulator